MKKAGSIGKRLTAIIMSGMLLIGSVPGTVYASEAQESSDQVAEIGIENSEISSDSETAVDAAEEMNEEVSSRDDEAPAHDNDETENGQNDANEDYDIETEDESIEEETETKDQQYASANEDSAFFLGKEFRTDDGSEIISFEEDNGEIRATWTAPDGNLSWPLYVTWDDDLHSKFSMYLSRQGTYGWGLISEDAIYGSTFKGELLEDGRWSISLKDSMGRRCAGNTFSLISLEEAGELSLEETYECYEGDSITISGTYVTSALEVDASFEGADGSILSFSGTSILSPSETGEVNTWYISTIVTANETGTYEITLNANGVTKSATLTVNPKKELSFTISSGGMGNTDALVIGEEELFSTVAYYDYIDQDSAQEEAENIKWTCSDTSAIELSNISYSVEKERVRISLSLRGKKPGNYTITGNTSDGRTASTDIVVEPKIVAISDNTTIKVTTDVVMLQTTLDYPNKEYLNSFLNNVTSEIKDDYGAIAGAISKEVVISDDGKTGKIVYKLTPVYGGSCVFTFMSAGGQKVVITIYSGIDKYPETDDTSKLGWCICNARASFGYSDNYQVSPDTIGALYGVNPGSVLYTTIVELFADWGSCFGMSLLAGADYMGTINLKQYFDHEGDYLYEYGFSWIGSKDGKDIFVISANNEILKVIERAHYAQVSKEFHDAEIYHNESNLKNLIDYLKETDSITLITFEAWSGFEKILHTVLIDPDKEIHECEDPGWYEIPIYDPNVPLGKSRLEDAHHWYTQDKSYILFNTNNGEFRYVYDGTVYGNYYKEWNRQLIKFYDLGNITPDFFESGLSMEVKPFEKIFGFTSENMTVEVNNNTILELKDGRVSSLEEGYGYENIYDNSDNISGKYMTLESEGNISYQSNAGKTIVSDISNEEIFIINNDNDISVTTEANTLTIQADHDAEIELIHRKGDERDYYESSCRISLLDGQELLLVSEDNEDAFYSDSNAEAYLKYDINGEITEKNTSINSNEDVKLINYSEEMSNNGIEIELDQAKYAVKEGDVLTIDATIKTDKTRVEGQKEYIGYFAYYANKQWNQLASWKIEGGMSKYRISKRIDNWTKFDDVMFTVSVFPKDSFTQGSALVDKVFLVTVSKKADEPTVEIVDSGSCGNNVAWAFDSNGKLQISGKGDMDNWTRESPSPWNKYASSIKTVIVEDGVTSIGEMAFYNCQEVNKVSLGKTVKSIGARSFMMTYELNEISIPDSVEVIKKSAFACSWLEKLTLGKGVQRIEDDAFGENFALTTVIFPESITFLGDAVFNGSGFKDIYFCGDAPEMGLHLFVNEEDATVYYPEWSETWDESTRNSQAWGNITWKTWNPGNKQSIHSADITLDNDVFVFNGSSIEPSVTVQVGDLILKENTDYTVSYNNNTTAGTAAVTITGKGKYAGTKTVGFNIDKAAQNITVKSSAVSLAVGKSATLSITGNKGTKSYKSSNTAIATVSTTGKITAKKVGTVKITATSAATANYNAAGKTVTIKVVPAATSSITAVNQAAGIKLTWKKVAGATGYKVYRGSTLIKIIKSGSTVTFIDSKANTNGTKYVFKIVPVASTGNGTAKSIGTYRVARPAISSVTNSASKKMTIKWGKNAKATGYQIQYSISKTFTSGNKAFIVNKGSTIAKVIGSLTKGKTYFVRVRTYKTAGSKKYWSAWSTVKSVKIKK